MDTRVTVLLCLEALFALWLLARSGAVKGAAAWSVVLTLLLAAFGPRLLAFKYQTLDYQDFLAPWVNFYRNNGGFRALYQPVGNYNVPYLYFLAFFSYLDIPDLYLIKLLSVFFDVLLAWAGLRLVSRLTDQPTARLGVFFAMLLLPSVYLNGAVWGQCDSIYVALALLALADALEDHPVRAMALLALSFSFKLQAVFLLPAAAVLLFTGKIKWKHLPVFPLVYLLAILPAVIAGRPLLDTLLIYFKQSGTVGTALNYNSSSFYGFVRDAADPALAAKLGVIAAFVFMLLILGLCFVFRRRLNDRLILLASVLLAVGIPFFLPHMHDRYFFAADALSLCLAFGLPLLSPVAALVQFGSLLGYYAYLVKRFLLYMDHGARAMVLALLLLLIAFAAEIRRTSEKGLDKHE